MTEYSWQAIYRSYDDASLEVLANAGLLRRAYKDVAAGKVAWLQQLPDQGVLSSDGQQVILTQKGAQAAQCDCPAGSCCKHILAAILWLRDQTQATASTDEDVTTIEDAAEPAVEHTETSLNVIPEILSLTPANLFKAAGKAATRTAYQWFQHAALNDSDAAAQITLEAHRAIIVIPSLATTVIYLLNGGFDGMLSEVKASERKAVHLLALALVCHDRQQTWQWPDAQATVLPPDPDQLNPAETSLLHRITAILQELLAQGLSHVSRSSATTLRMLNLTARAEGLPLLAAHLRSVGGLVSQLAERSDQISERQVLLQLAKVHALICALETASAEHLPQLRGQVRRHYQALQQHRELQLLPLGGHWWTTPGGARGLTLSFWETVQQTMLEVTMARPDAKDVTFRPYAVWSMQALWKQTPQQLCRTALTLHQPKFSDDGRLSSGAESTVSTTPLPHPDDVALQTVGIHAWSAIHQAINGHASLSSQLSKRILLRPVRLESPLLDEVRQAVLWAVYDRQGEQLFLDIPYSPERQHKITQIERLMQDKADIRAILVAVEMDGERIRLEPLSLLWVTAKQELATFSLDFDEIPAPKAGWVSPIMARIARLLSHKQTNSVLTQYEQPSLSKRLCEPALDVLVSLACTGRRQLSDYQREALINQANLADAAGVELLAVRLKALLNTPEFSPYDLYAACHLIDRLLLLDMQLT